MTLNHMSVLLPAICAYPQFVNDYTTSVNTVAGACWSGGLGGIGDSDQEGKIDTSSQASTSVVFQQIEQNNPGGHSDQYQALATGSASPGILNAHEGAEAAVGHTNANATSFFDDSYPIVGPGGGLTTVQLTLNYLITDGLNGLSAAFHFAMAVWLSLIGLAFSFRHKTKALKSLNRFLANSCSMKTHYEALQ